MKASAGPPAAALPPWPDGVLGAPCGWQMPPDAVDLSTATEQPEATEPCNAIASPEATELSRAMPDPDATEVSSETAVPDAVGLTRPPGGGATMLLVCWPVLAVPVFPPPFELLVLFD